MAGSTEPCLFCGGTGGKRTAEHVLPTWLSEVLPIAGRDLALVRMADGGIARAMPVLDVRIVDVCKTCNEGWMSELEVAFRSVLESAIRGGPIELDREGERIVALWSVKTWFLLNRALDYLTVTPVNAGLADYRDLYDRREPVPTFQIWIGRVHQDDDTVAWLANQIVRTPPDPPHGLIGVVAIGGIVFLIYGPFPRAIDDASVQVASLGLPPNLRRLFRPVFPPPADLGEWEPALAVPATELEKFWPSGGHVEPVRATSL